MPMLSEKVLKVGAKALKDALTRYPDSPETVVGIVFTTMKQYNDVEVFMEINPINQRAYQAAYRQDFKPEGTVTGRIAQEEPPYTVGERDNPWRNWRNPYDWSKVTSEIVNLDYASLENRVEASKLVAVTVTADKIPAAYLQKQTRFMGLDVVISSAQPAYGDPASLEEMALILINTSVQTILLNPDDLVVIYNSERLSKRLVHIHSRVEES